MKKNLSKFTQFLIILFSISSLGHELFKNPIISHILSNSSIENNYEGEEIQNTFNFDVNKYCQYIKNYNYKELVLENIRKVWGHYSSYYIFNLNK